MDRPQSPPPMVVMETPVQEEPTNKVSFPPVGSDARKSLLVAQAIPPTEMTTDEKLVEILVINREVQKFVTQFMNDMSGGKMGQMMNLMGSFMGGKK